MRKILPFSLVVFLTLFCACSSTQSLQEFFIDSAENPNFLKLDVPISILNLENGDLTVKQKEAVTSLRKLNVLAFKKNDSNAAEYEIEKAKLKAILKDEKLIELIKINTSYGKATIKYIGDEDAIDEIIIFGDNKEKGFLIVRVLGKNMNPANMMQLIQAVEKSDYNGDSFKQFENLLKS